MLPLLSSDRFRNDLGSLTASISHASIREHSKPLLKGGCCNHHGAVSEHRRRIAPLRLLLIQHSQIPKYAFALAAARLRGKLLTQFPCHEMILVPILNSPWV